MPRRRLALPNRRALPGVMNKTEAAYEARLKDEPGVVEVRFEAITLKLADGVRYTPDFLVVRYPLNADWDKQYLLAELHEVKGGWVDAKSRVKIKAAAHLFPWFDFIWAIGKRLAKKDGGPGFAWETSSIGRVA